MAAARVGTATAAQVLSGYTFTNSSSSGLNGSMTNQGTKTYTINPGGSQTIPAGYHSGSGTVTANANQNSGTYTFAAGSDGSTVDLGVNNTYRYINATNVGLTSTQSSQLTDLYNRYVTGTETNPTRGKISVSSSSYTVTLGYKPTAISIWGYGVNSYFTCWIIYHPSISSTNWYSIAFNSSPCTGTYQSAALGSACNNSGTLNRTNTGFSFNPSTYYTELYYIASKN